MKMDLLDTPPEMFGCVIAHLVTDAGTFRRSIEYEVLANQPTRAFLHAREASARCILRSNTTLYLRYRTTALKGAYGFLPRFIKRVCHTVSAGLPECDYQTRRQYERILCELLVYERQDVQALLTIKKPETSAKFAHAAHDFADDVSSNYIAAAAAVGDLSALREALRSDSDKLWDKSPAFGWPLVAAATGNHLEIVRAMVKRFEQSQHRTDVRYDESQFWIAIGAALEYDSLEVALLLLQIVREYGSPIPEDRLTSWISNVVSTRDSRIIQQVLALKPVTKWGCDKEFEAACEEGDLKAARMFIKKGFVSLNCAMSHGSSCPPIRLSVYPHYLYWPRVVEEVLKLGANPNGCYVPSMHDRPLWKAIDDNNEDIVRILLQQGANPELILPLWDARQDDFKESRAAIGALLIEAKHKQNYYVPPTKPRTQFAADAADLTIPEENGEEVSMQME